MSTMPQFPFPVELPDADDPYYGNPLFPHAMVLIDNKTGNKLYAVVIHFDGNGYVRVWLCKERRIATIKVDITPCKGAKIMSLDTDASFMCIDCGKPNDLHASTKRCTMCVAKGN